MPLIDSMKTWKIILLVVSALVIAFIGFVIYNGSQEASFYDNAEDLRPITFASPIFYEKLKSCSPAYSTGWEIRGLENNKCVVTYSNSKTDYDNGRITYQNVVCNLPYDIYTSEEIDWNESFCKA